jgi:hypothetical protein
VKAFRLLTSPDTGLLSGARFGRVVLKAYQLARTVRLLAKPRPRLLLAVDVGLGKTLHDGNPLNPVQTRFYFDVFG